MIVNFSASLIPSQNANSLQVVKTSNALINNNQKVCLFGRKSYLKENIKKYYNIDHQLDLIETKWIGIQFLGGILYGIINNIKLIKLKKNQNEQVNIYGRDIYSVLFSLFLNIGGVTYESHMIPSNYLKYFMESLLFKSKKFNKLITTSNTLKNAYINLYNINSEKIVVVNNGSDLHDYSGCDITRNELKNITYVGSLKSGKGVELIIKLAQVYKDIAFKVVGGNDHQISLLKKTYPIPDNVVFTGFIQQKDLEDIYKTSDILLAPYSDDSVEFRKVKVSLYPSPLKIIEYMSYGKIIVASDLDMCREILHNNHNALLCDVNNINAWIDAINLVKNDRNLACKLSNKAYIDFNNNYSWEIRAKKIINAIYNI